MLKLGIDLGGTKIEGILLDEKGREINRKRIPTQRDDGYDAIVDRICSLVYELKGVNETTIGICTPGSIDPKTEKLKNSNTVCLIDKPLKQNIESKIGQPIIMENDANCFALAEAKMGAGKKHSIVFGVILGTGVGGGIVIDGKIHHGRSHIAGEWGHHTLYPNGKNCYCGQKGCVEAYISGPALESRYKEITGDQKIVTDIALNPPSNWKNEFTQNFGIALSNVINILDPDVIVLGGGV
jgi:Transcriptional regulator/sugar kinase